MILGMYHFKEGGRVEDNIYGGEITAKEWSELLGFGPVMIGLETMAWMPDLLAPPRENHLVRSSAIVTSVVYGKGRVEYKTFDAPADTIDVLRLAFTPKSVTANGKALRATAKSGNGYSVKQLPGGDCLVTVRHDGARSIVVAGDNDPQVVVDDSQADYAGSWQSASDPSDNGKGAHVSGVRDSAATFRFTGNQVRLLGRADNSGGLADIFLDGTKQLVGIDCWTPTQSRSQQVLYYRNGLSNGAHELKIVIRGDKNAYSKGTNLYVDGIQYSAATATPNFGSGGGPTDAQRMIFGYPARQPYRDAAKHDWRPATEFVSRTGDRTDSVALTWWREPVKTAVGGTSDPELYRYGVHAPEFWANLTVGPGTYDVILKFAERREPSDPKRQPMNVAINGQRVVENLDVAGKAGGSGKALDLTFPNIQPKNGIIEIRFAGTNGGEAVVQAVEVVPSKSKQVSGLGDKPGTRDH